LIFSSLILACFFSLPLAAAGIYKLYKVARGRKAPRRNCFRRASFRVFTDPEDPHVAEPDVKMVNPFTFIQEVRAEAKKITWPSRRETMVTTGLVIAMVLLASLFFVLVDSVLRFIVKIVIGGGF
jgi:preprotein translocase subunit SecE